jgi:CubicO group peptidase (beta-lactamase class C family)
MVGYGYGLRVRRDCQGVVQVGHSGGLPGFGSNHTFLPEYGIGVIAFSNRTYAPATAVCAEALQALVREAGLQPRQLPASAILETRKEQVLQLLKSWDPALGNDFLAENFYLDSSREHRQRQAQSALASIGAITGIDPILPENQLRGTFRIRGEKGALSVFFTLSPEYVPKVQALDIRVLPNDK